MILEGNTVHVIYDKKTFIKSGWYKISPRFQGLGQQAAGKYDMKMARFNMNATKNIYHRAK